MHSIVWLRSGKSTSDGTQIPFPRLLAMFERAAPELVGEAFAQTSDRSYSGPIAAAVAMSREEFEDRCAAARMIVGHAGMGTIFAARRHRKPLIVVPRRFDLGEHRNDHQLGTAEQLAGVSPVAVCRDVGELAAALHDPPQPMGPADGAARERLVATLGLLIDTGLQRP